jgi:two-component system, NarL family, response regulator DegU
MNKIRVYLADDHPVVRKGMARLLKTFLRVGEVMDAANGRELISLIQNQLPDAVIIDIEMPVMGGVEAAKWISENFPSVKMLVLTMHTEEVFINKLMDLGVQGFLSKAAEPEELEEALYSIVDKDFYRNNIVEDALGKYSRTIREDVYARLSLREVEVLLLICQELTSKEISERLHISEKTFFNHRGNILEKTGARGNVGLLKYALLKGLIKG